MVILFAQKQSCLTQTCRAIDVGFWRLPGGCVRTNGRTARTTRHAFLPHTGWRFTFAQLHFCFQGGGGRSMGSGHTARRSPQPHSCRSKAVRELGRPACFLGANDEQLGEAVTRLLLGPDVFVALVLTGVLEQKGRIDEGVGCTWTWGSTAH